MAFSSFGTVLQADFGSGYTSIAEVGDIDGASLAQAIANVTEQQSTNRYSESISTVKDPGEITFTLMFSPTQATHSGLKDLLESGAKSNFKMIFPDTDNTEWSFVAIVMSIEPGLAIDGVSTTDINLKLTGNMSFTGGSLGLPLTLPFTLPS